jgi:BirA family biotin operon repressor/biotin-[acetyl-CoA-carboxylase] ligase
MSEPFAQHIGRRVLRFRRVASTNSIAARCADPADDGLVIVADEQTAGRGKPGRQWFAPPGTGLLVSVVLFPPPALRRPVILTVMSAVAVCETVSEHTRWHSVIKWPNDVLVAGKKVCGILIEQGPANTVIGIGLNVTTSPEAFADAGLEQAGSLAMFTSDGLDREAVLHTLLTRLDIAYRDLLNGRPNEIEACWRWHCGLLGQPVRVRSGEEDMTGRLLDVSFAAVLVESPDGTRRAFEPEAVAELMPFRHHTATPPSRPPADSR